MDIGRYIKTVVPARWRQANNQDGATPASASWSN